MTLSPVISADSHVVEPDNLFVDALGARHGDKLPRKVNERDGEKGTFLYTGIEYIRRRRPLGRRRDPQKLALANENPSYRLECLAGSSNSFGVPIFRIRADSSLIPSAGSSLTLVTRRPRCRKK